MSDKKLYFITIYGSYDGAPTVYDGKTYHFGDDELEATISWFNHEKIGLYYDYNSNMPKERLISAI